jgi:hypothetical protein
MTMGTMTFYEGKIAITDMSEARRRRETARKRSAPINVGIFRWRGNRNAQAVSGQ